MVSTRTRVYVALLLSLSMLSSGCWNRREIETLGFVTAVGVDRAVRENLTQLTVQIAKPAAVRPGTQGGGVSGTSLRGFWLVSSTGHTVFEAARNFFAQSPRRLYWPHNRWVILGEEAAREGIREYLDFLARDGEARRTALIAVVKDAKAADFLQAEFEIEPLPAQGMFDLIKTAVAGASTVVEVELHEFLIRLEDEGIEPVASRLEIIDKRPGDIVGLLERKEIFKSPRLTGAAAFKGDRLVGWLNKTETRGLLWIQGKTHSGILIIEDPKDEDKSIGLEMLRAGSKVTPQKRGGKIVMKIVITAEAYLGDVQTFVDPLEEPDLIPSIERRMATVIRNEITSVVDRAQRDFGSDIFGFGAAIHRSLPQEWQKLKNQWDEEFPRLDVEIEVKTKIRRSGLVIRSMKIK